MKEIFIFIILFQNIVLGHLEDFGYISFWDEFCFLCVFLYYSFVLIKRKRIFRESRYIILLLLICFIGLVGNSSFDYAYSGEAIIRDVIGFLKFPITFLAFYFLKIGDDLAVRMYKITPLLKIILWIIFCFGIISLFIDIGMSESEIRGFAHPYVFLYTHPTYLTTGCICILCILNASGEASLPYDVIALASVAMAMRTKGLAFIAVYIFTKYGGGWIQRYKILYWGAITILVAAASYSKVMLYMSYSNSPRQSLYLGAFRLARECFPVGSGFATFASHISGEFLSKVYNFIYIHEMYDFNGTISAVIGDAGLPYYIGQFGFIGFTLTIVLFWNMYLLSIKNMTKEYGIAIRLMWILILLSLPVETILLNNGFELGLIIAVVSRICMFRQNENLKKNKSRKKIHFIKRIYSLT